MNETEYAPGDPAPFSGIYELLNVLGFPSKTRIPRRQGEQLPPAPLGWSWRFVGTETNRPFPTGGEFCRLLGHLLMPKADVFQPSPVSKADVEASNALPYSYALREV